jgi:hypothetical protein
VDNKNLDIALEIWGNKLINQAKRNLIKQKKPDTGKLARSMKAKAENGVLSIYMEEYGIAVDTGRDGKNKKQNANSIFGKSARAAWPPVSAIKKWINTKPVKPRNLNNKKISVDSLTYVIGRSIYNKGIKPSLFFTDAFETELPGIGDFIVKAFAEDIEGLLNDLQNIETT